MIDYNKLKFTKPHLMKSWIIERYEVRNEALVALNMMVKVLERDKIIEISLDDGNVGISPLEPIPNER